MENQEQIFENYSGPDCVIPATSYASAKLDQPVKLRVDYARDNQKNHSYEPLSIYTRFKRTVEQGPDSKALGKY
jgi:hypothetical protein